MFKTVTRLSFEIIIGPTPKVSNFPFNKKTSEIELSQNLQ
jgi:hypothetical protein